MQNVMRSLFFIALLGGSIAATAPDLTFGGVAVGSMRSKTQVRLYMDIDKDSSLKEYANIIAYDLEVTDQFDVQLFQMPHSMKLFNYQALFEQGCDIVLMLEHQREGFWTRPKVQIRLIETAQGSPLGTFYAKEHDHALVASSHKLAAQILKALTGSVGVAQSTLVWTEGNAIRCADYACRNVKTLLAGDKRKFGLSWHTKAPMLFFSETRADKNILKSYHVQTKKMTTCSAFPGLNMQVALSPCGTKAVLVLSGGKGNPELFLYDQAVCSRVGRRIYKQLTQNGGVNVSPCYLPDGNIIFCSDFEARRLPQVYHLDVATLQVQRLTSGKGYCAAPSFCPINNLVVYTRSVNGVFQLCTLDFDEFKRTGKATERLLTTGVGHKTEPTWHESGTMIACVHDFVAKSGKKEVQIALVNAHTGALRTVTQGRCPKGYPIWHTSPLYAQI